MMRFIRILNLYTVRIVAYALYLVAFVLPALFVLVRRLVPKKTGWAGTKNISHDSSSPY